MALMETDCGGIRAGRIRGLRASASQCADDYWLTSASVSAHQSPAGLSVSEPSVALLIEIGVSHLTPDSPEFGSCRLEEGVGRVLSFPRPWGDSSGDSGYALCFRWRWWCSSC